MAFSWFKLSEECFWITEDVFGTDEAVHSPVDGLDCDFSTQRRAGSFAVAQLLACSNGSPRDVMGDHHADCVLNLHGVGA